MAKADIMNILYSKEKSPLEFQFDSLWMPSIFNYITPQDELQLYNVASSIKYASNIEMKYARIAEIMNNRGFKKFHCGTNRIIYRHLEDTNFITKIALDKVALQDNPAEYRNQFLLKPFVTKIFEVSPSATISTAERVEPITSRQEFMSIAGDIFELLNNCIIGKYVLEDIGSHYFMNYGLRKGFGAVLLDFTYVYPLDGNKLFCNKLDKRSGLFCGGSIDYDEGFNNLICTKCGKKYLAKQLQEDIKNKLLINKDEGESAMKINLRRGNQIIKSLNTDAESDCIEKRIRQRREDEERTVLPKLSNQTFNTIQDHVNQQPRKVDFDVSSKFIPTDKSTSDVDTNIIKQETKKETKTSDKSISDALGLDVNPIEQETTTTDKKEVVVETEKKTIVKEETIKETVVEKEDPIEKYREEYGDEYDSFEKIKKNNSIMSNY